MTRRLVSDCLAVCLAETIRDWADTYHGGVVNNRAVLDALANIGARHITANPSPDAQLADLDAMALAMGAMLKHYRTTAVTGNTAH